MQSDHLHTTFLWKARISLVGLLALLVVACRPSGEKTTPNTSSSTLPEDFAQQADRIVQDYRDLGIFSGVVLVADQGKPVYHKSFGLADRETGRPVELHTLFDIGSMNKTFTSIVIRQLAGEDKLALSDPLTRYVSGFSDPGVADITLQHLLEHRSGFGDYHNRGYFDLPMSERSLQAIVERAKSEDLMFAPGTDEAYSNLGYVILGAVIEEASGTSYFENVRERIVEPLGLRETYLNDFEGLQTRVAEGYYYTPMGNLEVSAPIQDVPNPDGGFLSTASDILKFYRSYYYDNLLLSEEAKNTDPFFEFLRNLPSGKATGAAGGFEGFNSVLLQVYQEDFSIVVLANMDEPVAERIGSDILSLYRGESPEKPQLPAVQNVRIQYEEHGIDYIRDHFGELTVNFHPTDPKDLILNALGYGYLYGAEDVEAALELFKLNTELFPESANCWDSLGEALKVRGDLQAAKTAYARALELDPGMETAQEALKSINP
jgi:CubicO group peptidase (beta-lactamase class C family)